MELTIKQTFIQLDETTFEVVIEREDKPPEVFSYTQSNKIYPIYNSLTATLRRLKNVKVQVLTNNPAIAEEYNAERENNFTSLLTTLKLTVERRNIDLSIELVD